MSAVCIDFGLPFPHPQFVPQMPMMAKLSRPCADCEKILTVAIRGSALRAWIDAGMPLENLEGWFVYRDHPGDEDLIPRQRTRPLTKAQVQALYATAAGGEALCGGCAKRRRLAERDLARAMVVSGRARGVHGAAIMPDAHR